MHLIFFEIQKLYKWLLFIYILEKVTVAEHYRSRFRVEVPGISL